eukprot:COSAG03_NODE_199_length_10789_cov_369.743312_15_plen_200_part_00
MLTEVASGRGAMSSASAGGAADSAAPAPFDRISAVEQTLARARAARARRQLATASSQPVGVPLSPTHAAHAAGGISIPRSDGSHHAHVEQKLQRLREREEQSAAQVEEHKAAMSVIATVPDPNTRRQALRTMSASARVAALLTMPEQEVQQISRAASRPLPSAPSSRDSHAAAAESHAQPAAGARTCPALALSRLLIPP